MLVRFCTISPVVHMLPTPPLWRERCKAVLDERGRGSRTRLSEEIGISTGAITQILDGHHKKSEHVLAISKALGVEPPPNPADPGAMAELLEVAEGLDQEGLDLLLEMAKKLNKG